MMAPGEKSYELFREALEVALEDRAAFLEERCAGDPALRAEVESLLTSDAKAENFLEPPKLSGLSIGVPTETLPDTPTRVFKKIGHYHIKGVIASGGMGTVYEATQENPRRTVALKLMKQGITSRSALRRFEYESQILARLRHPGIAQIYEAGTHRDDSGTTPYFAMEYIPNALPITKYATEQRLGTRQKLELFAQVCDAIHHGHQKGIIHRDLKPSNILVDSQGQVKIIDFGVARGTDSDLAVTTLQTDIGQLIGTLQYMSPEQCLADPHDIDTRSDVYALGVVFYELLCGKLPYDVTHKALHEATRIIREEQPAKLTTLNSKLRGDVETIALKALEKDRERRYQSATDFQQDIHRYLNNEAIAARPPSMVYQLRKFVRRNRSGVIATCVMATALIVSAVVSTTFAYRAAVERELYLEQLVVNAVLEAISGNLDAAEAVIKQADSLGTNHGRIRMLQGQVALQRGQPLEAINYLEQATALLPDNVAAQGMLAQAWDAEGTWAPYFRELSKLDKMTPVTFHDYLAKGAAESKMVPGQGMDLLDEAVRIRPGSAVARLIRADAGWRLVLHTLDPKDVERAQSDAHFAKEMLPGNPGALVAHLYVQLTASFYYKANGQLRESEAAFEIATADAEALKKFVDRPHAYRARMRFFQAAGLPHEALAEFRRGIQNTENNTYLRLGYGFLLAQLGEYDEAYENDPSLYSFWGMFFLADLPDGRTRVREAVDDTLTSAPPINNLYAQVSLRLLGAKDEAVEVSRTLRRQLLSFELPRYLREWYQPRFDFACDDLTKEEFLETAGNCPDALSQAHYFIGINRLTEGDSVGAKKHFQQSVEATAFAPGVEQVLARIFLAHLERNPGWTPAKSLSDDDTDR